jgi:phosphatidylethanolamine-binding protein (PEBP) family uncharacterized protein
MARIVGSQLAQVSLGNVAPSFASYDQLFVNGPAFADFPNASIAVTSASCGPSGSVMDPQYTGEGKGLFPHIKWEEPSSLDKLMQYLLIAEDPDAPAPEPVVHGLYYNINWRQHDIENKDLRPEGNEQYENLLVGGFLYGQNRRDTIYLPPSPPPGDGPHKYFYQVVGLSDNLDLDSFSSIPSRKELASAIEGKVAGWGAWVGVCERK